MAILGTEHLVDNIAVVRQQNESIGILIEPANREYALRVIDEIDDVALDMPLCGRCNADRLVQGNIDILRLRFDRAAFDANIVAFAHLAAKLSYSPINRNLPFGDPLV